jgi:hypothetical protein
MTGAVVFVTPLPPSMVSVGTVKVPSASSTCSCTCPAAEENLPRIVAFVAVMEVATATADAKCKIAVMASTPVSVVNRATLAP